MTVAMDLVILGAGGFARETVAAVAAVNAVRPTRLPRFFTGFLGVLVTVGGDTVCAVISSAPFRC